jgi:Ner family transcriptional regulator
MITDVAKKPVPKDWHKEDIKAAVRKQGTTLKGLALANGYRSADACAQALQHPYPKMERLIANFIGVPPETIWPSRYQGKYSPTCNASNVNPAVSH